LRKPPAREGYWRLGMSFLVGSQWEGYHFAPTPYHIEQRGTFRVSAKPFPWTSLPARLTISNRCCLGWGTLTITVNHGDHFILRHTVQNVHGFLHRRQRALGTESSKSSCEQREQITITSRQVRWVCELGVCNYSPLFDDLFTGPGKWTWHVGMEKIRFWRFGPRESRNR
jgi:hypothetical protein